MEVKPDGIGKCSLNSADCSKSMRGRCAPAPHKFVGAKQGGAGTVPALAAWWEHVESARGGCGATAHCLRAQRMP